MKNWDDEIHKALAHPIRRRIIECLQEKRTLSFYELLKHTALHNHGKFGFHLRALKGLVERDLSTKKYHLTRRGQLAGELIWDIRFTLAKGEPNLPYEPVRYVRHLTEGDHAVLFYDTDDIKHEISFPFLDVGLLKDEAVVYLVAESKIDSEKREIQRHGLNVDNFRKGAFTIKSAEEWYLKKGKAKAKTIIDNWLSLVKEKQKAGFIRLRGATEMEVFFNYGKSKELLRYEAALGRQLPPSLCGLCLYDTHMIKEQQFIQLNHSHGHSIFKGIAFKMT